MGSASAGIDQIQPRYPGQAVAVTVGLMIEDMSQIKPVHPGVIGAARGHVVPQVIHGRYLSRLVFLVELGDRQPLPVVFRKGEAVDIVEITMNPWQEKSGIGFEETKGVPG